MQYRGKKMNATRMRSQLLVVVEKSILFFGKLLFPQFFNLPVSKYQKKYHQADQIYYVP